MRWGIRLYRSDYQYCTRCKQRTLYWIIFNGLKDKPRICDSCIARTLGIENPVIEDDIKEFLSGAEEKKNS